MPWHQWSSGGSSNIFHTRRIGPLPSCKVKKRRNWSAHGHPMSHTGYHSTSSAMARLMVSRLRDSMNSMLATLPWHQQESTRAEMGKHDDLQQGYQSLQKQLINRCHGSRAGSERAQSDWGQIGLGLGSDWELPWTVSKKRVPQLQTKLQRTPCKTGGLNPTR